MDCSHHHFDYQEEAIDCHLTEERKQKIVKNKLVHHIWKNLRAFTGGSYRNSYRIYENEDGTIKLYVNMVKWGYRYYSKEEKRVNITLILKDGAYQPVYDDSIKEFDDIPLFECGRGIKPVQKVLESYYSQETAA